MTDVHVEAWLGIAIICMEPQIKCLQGFTRDDKSEHSSPPSPFSFLSLLYFSFYSKNKYF